MSEINFNNIIQYREWDEYDLAEDSLFDKYNLDIDAERQAEFMEKWLGLLTQAQSILAKRKEEMTYVEAELQLKARQATFEGISKPTEAVYKAWIITHKDYKRAQRKKRKAEEHVTYLQHAKSVLEHRKAMIKVEADLYMAGYFAKPSITNEARKQMEEERVEGHKKHLKKSLTKRKGHAAEGDS